MTVQQIKDISLKKILMLRLLTYKYNIQNKYTVPTHKMLCASLLKYVAYIKAHCIH